MVANVWWLLARGPVSSHIGLPLWLSHGLPQTVLSKREQRGSNSIAVPSLQKPLSPLSDSIHWKQVTQSGPLSEERKIWLGKDKCQIICMCISKPPHCSYTICGTGKSLGRMRFKKWFEQAPATSALWFSWICQTPRNIFILMIISLLMMKWLQNSQELHVYLVLSRGRERTFLLEVPMTLEK